MVDVIESPARAREEEKREEASQGPSGTRSDREKGRRNSERTFLDLALEDRNQADDAPERVVPAVEHQAAERLPRRLEARARQRRRDALDDRVEDRLDAPARLGADAQDVGRRAPEEVR